MFEIQKNDGTWEQQSATIVQKGADHFEVTIRWPGMVRGKVSMLDDQPCRVNGSPCRQVVGSDYQMNMPGGTVLVLQVLI